MHLTFVTGNPGKMEEAQRLLADLATLRQDRDGYTEIQTDTLEAVARHGLDEVARRIDPPFFLEDAGLFVDALNGFPGVYSAYVLRTLGWAGVLRLLEDHTGPTGRAARFAAVVAYRDAQGQDHLFRGEAHGHILEQARGAGGFGFDPIFTATAGDGRSFAELDAHEKDRLSHRGAAMRAFAAHLRGTTARAKDS